MVNIELHMNWSNPAVHIYDVNGRIVRTLHIPTPEHNCTSKLQWNGCDDSGGKLPSGIYIMRPRAGEYSVVEKLLLIR